MAGEVEIQVTKRQTRKRKTFWLPVAVRSREGWETVREGIKTEEPVMGDL